MGLEGSKDMDNVKGYIYFWIAFQTINTTLTPIAVHVSSYFLEPKETLNILFKARLSLVQKVPL